MKRRLFFSSAAIATLVAATLASAGVTGAGTDRKAALTHHGPSATRSYRSPGLIHKVIVSTEGSNAVARAASLGAVELAGYGAFKLFAMNQSALEAAVSASVSDVRGEDLTAAGPALTVRDDFNVLFLRSGSFDTTADDTPGTYFGVGGLEAARDSGGDQGTALRLIQFAGPIKGEWLDALREMGFDAIAYVPSNGYLIRGSARSHDRLIKSAQTASERGEGFVQWEGPFLDAYKIHPAVVEKMQQAGAEVMVAVQLAPLDSNRSIRDDREVSKIKRLAAAVSGDAYRVQRFTNLRIRIDASRIGEIAALPSVINIEPWSPPELTDERAAQVVAGNLNTDGKEPRGPGYLAWLQSHGFTSTFGFSIDVSDTGIDRGSTSAALLHPDFLDALGRSRVAYTRDYTSELDPSDSQGHGTINLSIAGGASTSAGPNMRDEAGYKFGLGVAPFSLLGSSKIFQSTGRFDLVDPYTKLVSEAYRDGARVSSNSWAAIANSYTIDSQEYDVRARDASPSEAGNQEIAICFAAGNVGAFRAIGSPGSAKNVISVAASESSRKDGVDGCFVSNEQSDSAIDMASFSSGGPLDDGRIKPDISAPGTHIQGAASQHPDFDGAAVCGDEIGKPYFPKGQTLYTWSSGTSHSTPAVAGAAALVRQFFLNRGDNPSAAVIKALLLNTTTYLTGALAGGDLPHPKQGWGLVNLGRAFDGASKVFADQSTTFRDSGEEFVLTGEVRDASAPFRVTLAWSDAPGVSAFASWVNDLDLEVTINGQVYRGNNFLGQESQPAGEPDTRNNVEAVWLPAGVTGTFAVRVRATNIAGDGVPGNGDLTDQDFALVIYNAERKDVAVATLAGTVLAGGADDAADPGETVAMRISLKNVSPVPFPAGPATLSSPTQGVSVTAAAAQFPAIGRDQTAESVTPFAFTIDRSVACGTRIQFVVDIDTQGSVSRVPFVVMAGRAQETEFFSDDVESGETKWTHASGIKKKKKRMDTWVTSTVRVRSGSRAWFTPDLGKVIDAHLDTVPITLPADGRGIELVFYHTFEFEGSFDGGVIEISDGGSFEDAGSKIVRGKYTGKILDFTDNPLGGREAWVAGRAGQFQQVVVDLSSFAGKTIVIRFRIATDESVKGIGWFIDDVGLRGTRVSCTPAVMEN
ncbi:MAG TPA: S8 family serine peptidase [Blastocatellia bacterium]|nr:S8 family serine peptidase [Blastocatellia bacterium]